MLAVEGANNGAFCYAFNDNLSSGDDLTRFFQYLVVQHSLSQSGVKVDVQVVLRGAAIHQNGDGITVYLANVMAS